MTGSPEHSPQREGREERIRRVSTLELFFDLVFVLTVTQLTARVVADPTARGVAEAAALLSVIFYMYGGYAWLTNEVAADRAGRRVALLGGMAAFLVIALAVPTALRDPSPAFGVAYLTVVGVHAALFARTTRSGVVRAIRSILPWNLATAGLVLAGTLVGGGIGLALLVGAGVASWGLASWVGVRGGFRVGAEHFVERHGLVVIIAIGESVVAIGAALDGREPDAGRTLVAVLALAVCAALWWLYFGGDDERAAAALEATDPRARARVALCGFGHAHAVMLFGIVLLAAGVKKVIVAPGQPSTTATVLLTGGVAVFLLGDVLFRQVLGIGRPGPRLTAALAVLLLGAGASVPAAGAGPVGVLIALTALIAWEGRSPGGAERRAGQPVSER